MDALLKALFGNGFDFAANGFGEKGIMGMLGSEGFSNLLSGGSSLMQGLQTGDLLDFQKDLATKADARSAALFKEDSKATKNRVGAFDDAEKILGF